MFDVKSQHRPPVVLPVDRIATQAAQASQSAMQPLDPSTFPLGST
jgi:hypothetical protein